MSEKQEIERTLIETKLKELRKEFANLLGMNKEESNENISVEIIVVSRQKTDVQICSLTDGEESLVNFARRQTR